MAATTENKPPKDPSSLDELITSIGLGPWTILYFIVAALSLAIEALALLGSEFLAPPTEFSCMDQAPLMHINGTECYMLRPATNGSKELEVSCKAFQYHDEIFETTITKEFNLVCGRSWMKEFFQISYTLGMTIGPPIGGVLADRYGRQPTVWYGAILMVGFTFIITVSSTMSVLLASRFAQGLADMMIASPGYILALEVCPLPMRSIYGVTVAIPYALMLSILAAIAYIFRQWRPTVLVGSIPLYLLVILSSPLILDESPRWLVGQGRLKEAERVLRRGAKINKTSHCLPQNFSGWLQNVYQNELKTSDRTSESDAVSVCSKIKSMAKSPYIRRITIVISIVSTFQCLLYISMPLRASEFSSPFLYMAMMGFAEFPAYIFSAPITHRIGRKNFIIGSLLVATAMGMVLAILMITGKDNDWIAILLTAIGFTAISSVYQVNVLFSAEIFPTSLRTIGVSLIDIMSNLGLCMPPLLEFFMPPELPWLPLVVYSSFAAIAAGLVVLLPETNNKPLLETVDEFKNEKSNHLKLTDKVHLAATKLPSYH